MNHFFGRQPLTTQDRVRSQASPRGICGGQIGTGTGISPSTSVFLRHFHPYTFVQLTPMLYILDIGSR